LATAIDLLTGCNWDFMETTRTILAAIGGEVAARRPLAIHRRNIKHNPAREKLLAICHTLRVFVSGKKTTTGVDPGIIHILGSQTSVKCWLAASLEKTIMKQLYP
jgi:hypothetical protein